MATLGRQTRGDSFSGLARTQPATDVGRRIFGGNRNFDGFFDRGCGGFKRVGFVAASCPASNIAVERISDNGLATFSAGDIGGRTVRRLRHPMIGSGIRGSRASGR